MTRNKHVDVMLALGIIFVVMGHRYQPEYLFFPAYTFHMALFFFIAGSLATIKQGLREKLRFVLYKSKTQLLTYFQYNLFFGVVTFLLALAGLKLGYNVPSFASRAAALDTVRDFFLVPFTDGHHYHLYLAAWFILQLYLVHVVFQVACWRPGRVYTGLVLAAAIPLTLVLLRKGLVSYTDLRLTGVRTSFAFLFYLLGYLVKTEEAALKRLLLAPAALVAEFVLVNVVAVNFGNIRYNIVLGNINNERVWVPVVTTLLIVLMVYQLAWHIASFISDDAFLLTLGRSTLPILIWHFSVFFAINASFYALGLITKENLSDNWFILNGQQTWLLYEVRPSASPSTWTACSIAARLRAARGGAAAHSAGRAVPRPQPPSPGTRVTVIFSSSASSMRILASPRSFFRRSSYSWALRCRSTLDAIWLFSSSRLRVSSGCLSITRRRWKPCGVSITDGQVWLASSLKAASATSLPKNSSCSRVR